MSYWKCNTNASSELDALLLKEDVTLAEIMDAEDIINQCKGQTKPLIDFLLKPNVLDELVTLTTSLPSDELDEKIRFKQPNIACELLTSDVPAINERLASDKALLNKLYNFLECEPPLNPLLASYFSRIMGALIARKTEQVLDFLKAKDSFLALLLKHLGTWAIMDLMLKLMTQVESTEMKQNILNWLDSNRIMQLLVMLLNGRTDMERHCNVAQLLCDFIRIARDTQKNATERVDPDPLVNTLESSETVALLLENMFDGEEKSESAIVAGIDVLLALIDVTTQSSSPVACNLNETFEIEPSNPRDISQITDAICVHLKHFHALLLNPPKKASIETTVGLLEIPLGNTRLRTIKLLAAIISTRKIDILNEVVALNTYSVLLDLFFEYPWNNFLHTQVENCIECALRTYSDENVDSNKNVLVHHLLTSCNVIDRMLNGWKENDLNQYEHKTARKGYMGHLISIINRIVDFCSSSISFGKYLEEILPETSKKLMAFKDTTLKDANSIQKSLLGGAYPNACNDDSEDYDIPFPQDQIYSSYQQQLSHALDSDSYAGYNDDAFDDTLQAAMDFNMSDGGDLSSQELFKRVCQQNMSSLDDLSSPDKTVFRMNIDDAGSSSDDDSPSKISMNLDPWKNIGKNGSVVDPWGASGTTANNTIMGDWADFSSVSFDNSFEKEKSSETSENDEKDVQVDNKEETGKEVDTLMSIVQSKLEEAIKNPIENEAGDIIKPNEEEVKTIVEPSIVLGVSDGEIVEKKETEMEEV